jgi:hypothetical protein
VAQVDKGPARGQRHLIVYGQHENGAAPGYPETASAARAARISIHVISLVPNTLLENLCQMTHGSFLLLPSEEELPGAVEQACLNLTARYTIRYQPVLPQATTLEIYVQSPGGWGETTLPVPPRPPPAAT